MERTKTNSKAGKWYVAYYIRFNSPQLKYGPFKSLKDLLQCKDLKAIMPGDLIVRMVSDESIFSVKYQFSPRFKWEYINLPFIYSNRSGQWKVLELNQKNINYGKDKVQGNSIPEKHVKQTRFSKNQNEQKKIW